MKDKIGNEAITTMDLEQAALLAENRLLRVLLANAYSGASLYRDDGELQDNRMIPYIDFRRDSAAEIVRKMTARAHEMLRQQSMATGGEHGNQS